ncbi:PTS sugar transporter subunit IIA [Vibrio scophthalmi]|uniref:PTS EIIA type-4 domain-containing protein n=1 Tax=Vibrio scophthalmi TaxID=45658 RepID=A0A1C7FE14_9VIBR|nr:hypothetical protein [Vibrio scophthalmi]ANU38146.1 hypothetical protein VSVS05_03108 [Vibrio scophthalmi]
MNKFYMATSHGTYAESTIKTLEMITGDSMPYVSLLSDMSKVSLKEQYLTLLEPNADKEIIIFVDVLCGTPFNCLMEIKLEYPHYNITLVTGLSLILIVEVLDSDRVNNEVLSNVFENTKIIREIEFDSQIGEEED